MLNTAPMKCLKGPVPRVVATASGEAAADQEMAHLLLAQELSGISRSEELPVVGRWNMCVLGAMTISGGYALALRCYALVSSKLR